MKDEERGERGVVWFLVSLEGVPFFSTRIS